MTNFSTLTVIFTAYGPPGPSNQAFFFFLFVVYVSILCVNLFLVLVIWVEESLHRPMYILLVSLAINEVIGSSSVCPKIMEFLLVDKRESSLGGCLTQVFFSNFYGSGVYAVLALMAYDRYVSICKPLQYHSIMTPSRLRLLLAAAYLVPCSCIGLQIYLSSQIQLCSNTIDKFLCDHQSVLSLSCHSKSWLHTYSLVLIVCLIFVPFFLVILSYIHILTVSLRMPKESQKRALRTCTPHLITFINFSTVSSLVVIYNRINLNLTYSVNLFICISFIFIPPLVHPVIYGIKTKQIRKSVQKIIRQRKLPS
ncbi:olfactory receptor 6B2-like [Myripristis murdjan]|uniref:Odorant receptor, family 60, subfamily A, member 1 n=1 Tax=Myripristis murdjan TaxID=586833 RepID=A0A667WXQ5_9TELE|nr:olfactory receptor 6B2-like [Myripristis murdjan]